MYAPIGTAEAASSCKHSKEDSDPGLKISFKMIKALLRTEVIFPISLSGPSPKHYCSVSSASRLAAAQDHTALLQEHSNIARGYSPPHVRVLHNVLWMLRTVVNHHTQYLSGITIPASHTQQQAASGLWAKEQRLAASTPSANKKPCLGGASARAFSVLAVAQLLPTGIALVRSALAKSTTSMTTVEAVHMLTDLLLPAHEYIELLLDIVAWPGSVESSYIDPAGDLVVHVAAAEFTTWEIIASAIEPLQMCWILALAADTAATTACTGDLSKLLHNTTRRLLLLVQHHFHDAVLTDHALGGMVGLFLRETVMEPCKDLNTFPAVMKHFLQRTAASHGSSRGGDCGCAGLLVSKAAELVPDSGHRDRFARGFDGVTKLLEANVMTALDTLIRTKGMPSSIVGEVTRFQTKILFWIRAAMLPLCILGPGPPSWSENVTVRRAKMRATGRVAADQPVVEYGMDTTESTMFNLLQVSQPLFCQLLATQEQKHTSVKTSSSSGAASSVTLHFQTAHKPLPPQLWLDCHNSMCRLLIHAGMSLFFCAYDDQVISRSQIKLSPILPQAYARLGAMQRREAACSQLSVKGLRTGCCNLNCTMSEVRSCNGQGTVPLLRCSKCTCVSYCCRGCQREAWAGHRGLCDHLVLHKMLKEAMVREGL